MACLIIVLQSSRSCDSAISAMSESVVQEEGRVFLRLRRGGESSPGRARRTEIACEWRADAAASGSRKRSGEKGGQPFSPAPTDIPSAVALGLFCSGATHSPLATSPRALAAAAAAARLKTMTLGRPGKQPSWQSARSTVDGSQPP